MTSRPFPLQSRFRRFVGFLSPLLLVGFVGCGAGTTQGPRSTAGAEDAGRFFPLREGNVWSYNIDTGETVPTLGITRVVRVAGNQVEVSANDQPPQTYELRPEGIYRVGKDAWLLRSPVTLGASWPSSLGKTARVTAVGSTVETRAGTFPDCAVVEEVGGPDEARVATTYCPDVGPVRIVSSMALEHTPAGAEVSAILIGYDVTGSDQN